MVGLNWLPISSTGSGKARIQTNSKAFLWCSNKTFVLDLLRVCLTFFLKHSLWIWRIFEDFCDIYRTRKSTKWQNEEIEMKSCGTVALIDVDLARVWHVSWWSKFLIVTVHDVWLRNWVNHIYCMDRLHVKLRDSGRTDHRKRTDIASRLRNFSKLTAEWRFELSA